MRIQLTIVVAFLLSAIQAGACECVPPKNVEEARIEEYKEADYVLLGTVQRISDGRNTVIFVVREVFKGDLVSSREIVIGNNPLCEPSIFELGEWLIYATKKDGVIAINQCGLSRSTENPENNRFFREPLPPIPVDSEYSREEWNARLEALRIEQRKVAKEELDQEIAWLRSKVRK